jgi:hypothetical protein
MYQVGEGGEGGRTYRQAGTLGGHSGQQDAGLPVGEPEFPDKSCPQAGNGSGVAERQHMQR